jgi:hypothetical protein
MNARQTKKNLKRKIQKLELDNNLMKSIIEDHSEMLRLYDLYNSPRFLTQTTIRFKKYRAEEIVPLFETFYPDQCDERMIERIKCSLVKKMFDAVKENTIFDVERREMLVRVRATLYLGKKDDLDDESEGR